uniref:GNAT family acetyltransferase n=1 Tax=Gronococcus sybilensis TaxID=3028029 RepID=A0A9Y1I2K5_9RHOD|nr:GNAT family acetyltransferase [Gronococcus sybilensis]
MSFWNYWHKVLELYDVNENQTFNSDSTKLLTKELQSANISIHKNIPVDLHELEKLCRAVDWSDRPLRKVNKALQNSYLVVSVIKQTKKHKRLIGFARVISDCAFNATIWDVVVHPDFQGMKIGKTLMLTIIEHLQKEDISSISLFSDPRALYFYQKMGFIYDLHGVKGMFWSPTE